ncbi:hypothetical protein LTR49_024834 [Elasticomyces elasticus]|nr:hypothetical protein LTR49_024834 [Elasticomyces elasticus]
MHFTSFLRRPPVTQHPQRIATDPGKDLSFLVYSSGTTGRPKGVMLSHRNIVANVLMLSVTEGAELSYEGGADGRGDRILAFLPFSHIYEYRTTYAYVVPPVILELGKDEVVDKFDLRSMRMMSSGAAPLTKDLVQAVYKRLKVPIKQGYGLSETSPTTHTQRWEDWNTTLGSVGLLLPNQTTKYMDPNGKEVLAGQMGELWIKGPNVFMGYLNNQKAAKYALTDDGYFKTGDVGYQDESGNFYITDRVKNSSSPRTFKWHQRNSKVSWPAIQTLPTWP